MPALLRWLVVGVVTLAHWGAVSFTVNERRVCARRRSSSVRAERSFEDLFVGDFDNYDQITAERRAGIDSKDPTGHEHVHCALRPIPEARAAALIGAAETAAADSVVLACYYLDGDPKRVFRLRGYALTLHGDGSRTMRLFRPPVAGLEGAHAAAADLPRRGVEAVAAEIVVGGGKSGLPWDRLDGCDVTWRREAAASYRGRMPPGGCRISSQYNASRTMLIKDDLVLGANGLWVDDRGYDGQTGALVYGAVDGTPYKMQRVLRNGKLAWTLGLCEDDNNDDVLLPTTTSESSMKNAAAAAPS